MPRVVEDHFPIHGAVPPSELVGRTEAVRDMALRLRLGHNLIVAGPRRTGKSSAAAATAALLEADGVTVIPLEFMYTTTLEAFCREAFEACARAAAGGSGWWERLAAAARQTGLSSTLRVKLGPLMEIGLGLASGRAPELRLQAALSLPGQLSARLNRRVVVVMDEFQDAGKLHADFYRILRHWVTGAERVSYLFLGSRAGLLRNLFVRHNEPLYRAAVEYELPDAAADAWEAYLRRKLAEVGIESTAASLGALLARTGGHPQDTMMLAADAYARLCGEGRDTLTSDDVAECGDRLLTTLAMGFENWWSELSADRGVRIALPRIATGAAVYHNLSGSEGAAVSLALRRVVREGVARRLGRGKYALREPLFGEWLRRTVAS